jgi:hypothetical protein
MCPTGELCQDNTNEADAAVAAECKQYGGEITDLLRSTWDQVITLDVTFRAANDFDVKDGSGKQLMDSMLDGCDVWPRSFLAAVTSAMKTDKTLSNWKKVHPCLSSFNIQRRLNMAIIFYIAQRDDELVQTMTSICRQHSFHEFANVMEQYAKTSLDDINTSWQTAQVKFHEYLDVFQIESMQLLQHTVMLDILHLLLGVNFRIFQQNVSTHEFTHEMFVPCVANTKTESCRMILTVNLYKGLDRPVTNWFFMTDEVTAGVLTKCTNPIIAVVKKKRVRVKAIKSALKEQQAPEAATSTTASVSTVSPSKTTDFFGRATVVSASTSPASPSIIEPTQGPVAPMVTVDPVDARCPPSPKKVKPTKRPRSKKADKIGNDGKIIPPVKKERAKPVRKKDGSAKTVSKKTKKVSLPSASIQNGTSLQERNTARLKRIHNEMHTLLLELAEAIDAESNE